MLGAGAVEEHGEEVHAVVPVAFRRRGRVELRALGRRSRWWRSRRERVAGSGDAERGASGSSSLGGGVGDRVSPGCLVPGSAAVDVECFDCPRNDVERVGPTRRHRAPHRPPFPRLPAPVDSTHTVQSDPSSEPPHGITYAIGQALETEVKPLNVQVLTGRRLGHHTATDKRSPRDVPPLECVAPWADRERVSHRFVVPDPGHL